jgi:hypothetical protein
MENIGVRQNQMGFDIIWASGKVVVVEASTDQAHPVWFPLQTITLSGDSVYFSDAQWADHTNRLYRVRAP